MLSPKQVPYIMLGLTWKVNDLAALMSQKISKSLQKEQALPQHAM